MGEPLAPQIGQPELRPDRPERDPGDEAVASVELHEERTPSAARGARAEVGDQPAVDQVGDETPHRGRRKPRGLDQLGPRERSRAIHGEGLDPLEVQPPQVTGVASPHLAGRSRRSTRPLES